MMVNIIRRLTSRVYLHQQPSDTIAAATAGRCTVLWQHCTTPSLLLCLYLSRVRSLCNADGRTDGRTDSSGPIHHAARVIILSNTPTQELRRDPRYVSIGIICGLQ
jgi:hypothetical protein